MPEPAPVDAATRALAARLGTRLRLGTSSWHFPGWRGLVWAAEHAAPVLSKRGLAAYAQHPLLRAVSLDRAFYRPLDAAQYAALASQVPADFRFVVKAPSTVSDAVLRDADDGRALRPNPQFLDPALALDGFVRPAARGLGANAGALVLQLSPLPAHWLRRDRALLFERLARLLGACRAELPADTALAVEVRDAALLMPDFAALLNRVGARYCLGLHDRLPSAEAQLPMLRATWPGALVCRWNLQRGLRYDAAKARFAPFDRMLAPDPATRAVLTRAAFGTAAAGHAATITVNNKAEGSAPLSVRELAMALNAMFSAVECHLP